VLQHPLAYDISLIYIACGVPLGNVALYKGYAPVGYAVIVPPAHQKGYRLAGLKRVQTIAVTGWAHNPHGRFRLRVDHAVPLSDHADFDQLVRCVEQVDPRVVLCTHGSPSFVEHLRVRGFNAHVLDEQAHRMAKTW
jgi:hypothetical protein